MSTRFFMVATFALATAASAQNSTKELERVYVGSDSLAHVVDRSGLDKAMPRGVGELEANDPKLSPDHHFAGWTINVENCCTSYPIPLSMAIYSSGKIVNVDGDGDGDGQMIYDWCFVPGKAEVAISRGPTHGDAPPQFKLADAVSGRVLARWIGEDRARAPIWARCLKL